MSSSFFSKTLSVGKQQLFSMIAPAAIAATVFGLLHPPLVRAQSQQATGTPSSSFDVASIKPNRSADGLIRLMFAPDGFNATGMSTKALIAFAYNVKEFQISGGPGWLDSERYNIDAKMDEPTIEALRKMPPEQATEQRRVMMQSLLKERFKLKVSQSSKELPIYALVAAKSGPKLSPSADQSSGPGAGPRSQMRFMPGELTANGIPIGTLADRLSREVGRKVVDKTGLQGRYDFTLHWAQERQGAMAGAADGGAGAAPLPDSSGPSIFTALQEQLGLKLESQKGLVETVVIDSIDKPSEN
jgi:uncharacterized protein (TIGR03435 family)